MSCMFSNCKNLKEFCISNDFQTLNLKYAQCMFYNCINLNNLYPYSFYFKKVKNVSRMFFNCRKLEILDIDFNIEMIKLLQDMAGIFTYCEKLDPKNIVSTNKFVVNQINDLRLLFLENNKTED